MMKKNIMLSFVLAFCLCFVMAMPALAADEVTRDDDINLVDISEVDQNLRSAVSDADMFIMTKSQAIPVYLEDNISSEQVDKSEVQAVLIEAENKATDTEDYNLYVFEDDLTYFYADVNGEISLSVFETQMDETFTDKDTFVDEGISPLAYGYESEEKIPDGIGCKAYTYSTKNTVFEATFYTDNMNYAGSVSNFEGNDVNKMINLYNYIGNVAINGISTDMGVQYSATHSGWQPYFHHNYNNTYTEPMYLAGEGLCYKGTASAPTTIKIDRYAVYNGLCRFKTTVSGKTTSNTNGETVMFGGRYIDSSVSVQYKVVSTIATKNMNNIKNGAGFNTYWTNVKINGTPVNSYSIAYYWDGTITKLSSAGVDFKILKTNRSNPKTR